MEKIPINDTVIYALARLVDDSQKDRRDPSHSDLEYQINKYNLACANPNKINKLSPVGKAKRIRGVLSWAFDNDIDNCERISLGIINSVKSCGGFRENSKNYVGKESINNLIEALKPLNIIMSSDGTISLQILDSLSGIELTKALTVYIERAKKGIEDAALLVGTGKDLIEAVAAHVLVELWGNYPQKDNFPMLLGQLLQQYMTLLIFFGMISCLLRQ